jgi:hypothetical protein
MKTDKDLHSTPPGIQMEERHTFTEWLNIIESRKQVAFVKPLLCTVASSELSYEARQLPPTVRGYEKWRG